MKKAFLFIVLLTTSIINSKTVDDQELNQFIDTLKHQTDLLHQQRIVLINLKNRLSPYLNLPLSPIPQFNAAALKLLPIEQRREIAMRIDQNVQNRREFYTLTSEYLERVQRQSDPVESNL